MISISRINEIYYFLSRKSGNPTLSLFHPVQVESSKETLQALCLPYFSPNNALLTAVYSGQIAKTSRLSHRFPYF